MSTSIKKSNKINLTNYGYVRDIENRLLLAQLSVFEVEVLKEILNNSLKFSVIQLADSLNVNKQSLIPILDKLSATKLFERDNDYVVVNKELRKYYEIQILKFDEDFEPGMEFFQSLLSKVPIHTLLDWYSISRSSDHIFHSIIEKYLKTPKIFEQYTHEIHFDEPQLLNIFQDVLNAPDFKIPSRELIEKYKLSHEQFEQFMLILEFNMLCCISYEMIDDTWEEIVTPFYEWREYLKFVRDTSPQTITETSTIQRLHSNDFGFIKDLISILNALKVSSLPIEQLTDSEGYYLSETVAKKILEDSIKTPLSSFYLTQLIDRLILLQLATISDQHLHITANAEEWLKLSVHNQAHTLYRLPPAANSIVVNFSEKDMREVEKNLRRVAHSGWVAFEDFFAGMTISLNGLEAVHLRCKGKRWKYCIPSYSEEERQFVKAMLCEKLFETGMVAIGFQGEAFCFYVTPFGRMTIGE